jgi:hypothetical protein
MNYAVEYAKYLKDPIYCIESNFKVFDMTQNGFINYRLFDQQKKFIRACEENRKVIVAKPRQAGVSTTLAAYLAVKIALASPSSPEKVEILSNSLLQSQEFLSKVRDFTCDIPAWVWGKTYNWNKAKDGHIIGKGAMKRVEFSNGSYIAAKPCTKDALRGTSPTFLVIDEAAFVEDGKDVYGAAAAATATGGKIFIVSTPNGMDELYYKTYINAMNKKNGFHIVRMHWALDPRYNKGLCWIKKDKKGAEIERELEDDFSDQNILTKLQSGLYPISPWFEEMCDSLNHDKKKIAQELEVKFEGSAGNVIDVDAIQFYEENMVKNPIKIDGPDKNMWIWKYPEKDHKYIAGADCATGDDMDYNTFSILDVDTLEIVAEYHGQLKNDDFAAIINKYAKMYKCMTVIDTTGGYADALIYILEKMDFAYFYKTIIDDSLDGEGGLLKKEKIGFKIQKHRRAAISFFVSKIENFELKAYSVRQVNEWRTFVWKNGRADHQSGFNDDLITSVVMPLWVLNSVYEKIEKINEDQKTIFNYMSKKSKERESKQRQSTQLKKIYGQHAWVMSGLIHKEVNTKQ